MFRYPCSFLIHSEAFDALPAPMLDVVYGRLIEILNASPGSTDEAAPFDHLSSADRIAIREILVETKPEFRERLTAISKATP